MKNRMITLAVFGLTLAGGGAIIASNALAKAPPLAATHTAERHPELRKALNQLEAAKRTMRDAAWDFGGHKTDAMRDTQQAIDELHKALKFDKH